jgi:hypothetical protein
LQRAVQAGEVDGDIHYHHSLAENGTVADEIVNRPLQLAKPGDAAGVLLGVTRVMSYAPVLGRPHPGKSLQKLQRNRFRQLQCVTFRMFRRQRLRSSRTSEEPSDAAGTSAACRGPALSASVDAIVEIPAPGEQQGIPTCPDPRRILVAIAKLAGFRSGLHAPASRHPQIRNRETEQPDRGRVITLGNAGVLAGPHCSVQHRGRPATQSSVNPAVSAGQDVRDGHAIAEKAIRPYCHLPGAAGRPVGNDQLGCP